MLAKAESETGTDAWGGRRRGLSGAMFGPHTPVSRSNVHSRIEARLSPVGFLRTPGPTALS